MKAQCGASIKIAYVLFSLQVQTTFSLVHVPAHRSPLFSSAQSTETVAHAEQSSFEDVVLNRRSAKSFQRFDGSDSSTGKPTASKSDPRVVQQALHCLDLARRTPTAYNSQPYKVVLVHSQEQKLALSRYCLGPNAARVLDSDCTAIFLADRQIFRTLSRYRQFVEAIRESTGRKPLQRKAVWQTYFYILLFSSGWPLPRFLAAPITFVVRTAFAFVNIFTRWFYPMPSLANAETWSSKQVMMVAMTYILGCTSLGLATLPMEGINAGGIRKVIQAPSRYAIPLVVCTGRRYKDEETKQSSGLPIADRYPIEELIFDDTFGSQLQIAPSPSST